MQLIILYYNPSLVQCKGCGDAGEFIFIWNSDQLQGLKYIMQIYFNLQF